MATTIQVETPETTLSDLFQKNEITKIAIIDDAFDVPQKDNVEIQNIETFLVEVGKSDEAKESWKGNGLADFEDDFDEVDTEDINNDDAISKLWGICNNNKCELSRIGRDTLFSSQFQRKDSIKPLIDFLSSNVVVPETFPSSSSADDLADFRVFFIDYYLSQGPNDEEAIKTAINLARDTYDKNKKQLFLLISTNDVNRDEINEFIEAANLVGGVFYFIKKDNFTDSLKLHLKLSNAIKALPHSTSIQNFTEAIVSSLEKAKVDFLNSIRRLSLEDYSHLYRLSLKSDGHPLGDYMLWLFESYFGHLLFKNNNDLRDAQKALDTVDFQDDMIRQLIPSQTVSDFHSHAMFSSIEDIVEIPDGVEELTADSSLSLGDIFINGDKVLMVLNAQCDLADQRRKYNPDLQLLLIPGELTSLESKLVSEKRSHPLTQIFEHEANKYRIAWNTRDVFSCKHSKLFETVKHEMGFEREYRLKMPYSLEIQHAFTFNVTRVGIPVMPPIDLPVTAKLYYKQGGNTVSFDDDFDGIYITSRRINPADDKDHDPKFLCFTEGFINKIIDKLRSLISDIEAKIAASQGETEKRKLNTYKEKLEKLLTHDEMEKLTKLAKFKKGKLNGTSIIISEGRELPSFESICICLANEEDPDAE